MLARVAATEDIHQTVGGVYKPFNSVANVPAEREKNLTLAKH